MAKLEIKSSRPKVVTKTFRLSEELVARMNVIADKHNVSLNALTEQMLGYAVKNLKE